MSEKDNTVEGLIEFFYTHCPFARVMRGKSLTEFKLQKTPLKNVRWFVGDLDCDAFILKQYGEAERWENARMKIISLARFTNRILLTELNGRVDGKMPSVKFGEPTHTHELIAGKDFDVRDEKGARFITPYSTIMVTEPRTSFFTPVELVDIGELRHKPVLRFRMEYNYYELDQKENP